MPAIDFDAAILRDLILSTADALEYEFRGSYGARGSYSRTCVGVVVPANEGLFLFGMHLAIVAEEHGFDPSIVADLLKGATIDSMGHSLILYWPRVVSAPDANDPDNDCDDEHAASVGV
jgi:hypothetical protein